MGEGELIRKVVGRPRKVWNSETERFEWIKEQYALLGIKGPLYDEFGKKLEVTTDEGAKPGP